MKTITIVNHDKIPINTRILGIDEAGRGAVIGPLIIAGVTVPEEKLKNIKRIGVKDSKKLSVKKRMTLSRKIKKIADYQITCITAEDIDNYRANNKNLNTIEKDAMKNIVKKADTEKCYIDCLDIKEERFHNEMQELYPNIDFTTEHKADDTYPIVSAASIIAKVERDKIIKELKKEYGEIGSGYPSDKKTIKYLKHIPKKELPAIVRKSWNTVKNLDTWKIK